MTVVVVVARLLLVVVFAVAGVAKLADLAGSRQAMREFGLPPRTAAPLALLLPVAELAVAAGLLLTASARWAAVGALALLLAFTVAITVNVLGGRRPNCHCFGQLHSAPAGWGAVGRNLALSVVAGFVVLAEPQAGTTAGGWVPNLTIGWVAALAAGVGMAAGLAFLGWLVLHLFQQQGRLLLRLEALEAAPGPGGAPVQHSHHSPPAGLPVGAPAPSFALPGLDGAVTTSEGLRADGNPTLLVFTDPGCGPCAGLLPDVGRWQRELADRLAVVVVSAGDLDANREKAATASLRQVLLQRDHEVAAAFGAPGTPTAVLVSPDGTIASPLAQGADEVRNLAITASQHHQPAGDRVLLPLLPSARPQTNGNTHNHHHPSQNTPTP